MRQILSARLTLHKIVHVFLSTTDGRELYFSSLTCHCRRIVVLPFCSDRCIEERYHTPAVPAIEHIELANLVLSAAGQETLRQ